jgi:hypothetical protein
MMRSVRFLLVVLVVLGVMVVGLIPAFGQEEDHEHDVELSPELARLIADVRGETATYRELTNAEEAGYGKFLDCFINTEDVGMGQHFVNGDYVGDDVLDPMKPEALVYEPQADGSMILVAMEYLVFEDQWTESDPPMLFDQEFHLRTNIPETPPVWALHIWLHSHNPDGLFADYNPIIFCPEDYPTTTPQ